jgi:AsmA-like C-terminal region/AsmA family
MRKSHKVLLFFLIAFAAAIVAFTKTFNSLAAKNREQVLQELQRFLGKEATFDRLEASLWGGLGFSAKEFRIADDPHFAATPVVHAQEMRLGVSLLPLLLGKIVIDSLTFQAPEFQIITDERGLLNLAELAGQKKETRAVPRSQTPSSERKVLTVDFRVGKITVKNGRVDFIDRSVKEPAEIRVKNVEMEVKGFNPSEKTRIRFAAAVTEGLGYDVRIDGELGPLGQPHDWLQQPVELAMRFDSLSATLLARALPFLRNRIPRELDVTGPLSLQANLEGTFKRPRITDIALKIPLFGSSNYNAILEGSVETPEGGPWAEAQLKGKLTLNSINLTQLRSLPLLKQILPINLVTEGTVNAYGKFEGTWANLRVGALIRGEKGEFRYADWFRKPAGNPAELKARISRQKNALVLHDSELSLGNSKLRLSGVVTEASDPRLQLKLRSDSSHLPTWWQLVSPLSFYSVAGTIHWDVVLQKNLASADGWNIQGKLSLANAEFKHKETGRQIDHLNAVVSFLGRDASLENGSFRLGSSRITIVAEGPVLTERRARYKLQSAELNLMDLPTFPASKPTQIKNVTAKGEIQWQTHVPLITGTIASSEGSLEDIPYRELRGDITWSPEGITFKNLSLQAFEGVLRSDGYWPVAVEKPQRFTLKSQIESIEVGSLLELKLPQLRNRIEGQLNFRGQFDAARQNGVTFAEALQGSGESIVQNGSIRDFNLIAKIIPGGGGDPASSKGSSRLPASLAALVDRPYTPFDTLKANFRVEGQRIRTDELSLVTPDYTITGAGWVGFDRTTQWNGLLVFSPRVTQELQREYKMIRYLLDRRGRLSIAFRAEGKFPNVKVKPENRAVAQVLRRSFPQKADDSAVGAGKSSEKNERKTWLPESLEQLLKQ